MTQYKSSPIPIKKSKPIKIFSIKDPLFNQPDPSINKILDFPSKTHYSNKLLP